MKGLTALLMLAALLLLPLRGMSASTDLSAAAVSPDGVPLLDFARDSAVWGRTFTFNPPAGVAEHEIFSLCESEGTGSGGAMWVCLTPYIKEVKWTLPGTPGAWTVNPAAGLPAPPSVGVNTVTDTTVTFDTGNFVIYDDIDCCNNKNAEGFVVYSAYTSSGWSTSPKIYCATQSASSGSCNADASNTFVILGVGLNSCPGILGRVEFKDEDVSSDDTMDISSRLNDAVADIQYILPAGSSPCNAEDNMWWSETNNTDSPLADRCQGIAVNTVCDLTGQGDATGDNDDAGLDFTLH